MTRDQSQARSGESRGRCMPAEGRGPSAVEKRAGEYEGFRFGGSVG
jgi:hypothetical protein